MSQHADGGVVGTKPYIASGAYIERMSNYCQDCRYRPTRATGPDACPFTTLYWDFLVRHHESLAGNPRMRYPLQSLARKDPSELAAIRKQAATLRA
jgi:deoxyribodipyrimidine photolyase-related protein